VIGVYIINKVIIFRIKILDIGTEQGVGGQQEFGLDLNAFEGRLANIFGWEDDRSQRILS
jgi:hypothetical protein